MWVEQRVWVLGDEDLNESIPKICKDRIGEIESVQARFYYVLTVIKLMESHMRIRRGQLYRIANIDSGEYFWILFDFNESNQELIFNSIKLAERDFCRIENRRFKELTAESFSIEDFLYLVL